MRTPLMKLFGCCAGAGILVAAAATSAQAAAAAPQTRNALECRSAPGPGTWNSICVSVAGRGERVEYVSVSYNSTTFPYIPTPFCDATAHVFGTHTDGRHYSGYGRVGCADGAVTWVFTIDPEDDAFKANSWLCGTVSWGGRTSDPDCVQVGGSEIYS